MPQIKALESLKCYLLKLFLANFNPCPVETLQRQTDLNIPFSYKTDLLFFFSHLYVLYCSVHQHQSFLSSLFPQYVFVSLLSRDSVYDVLRRICTHLQVRGWTEDVLRTCIIQTVNCAFYMSGLISSPSPGQWEESEPEAVHGGAHSILGQCQLVFHTEIIKASTVKIKVLETFRYLI